MKIIGLGLTVVLVSVLLLSVGCNAAKGEGFAIYLTRDDVPPEQMEVLSYIGIEDKPVISVADIVRYHPRTHQMELTTSAFERISRLEVPVRGKSFVVCVDRAPVYWGAFWTPVSSMSFNGVTIWKPLGTQGPQAITLELGYPSSSFYRGEDPRNSPEVMDSLKEAGKLAD